jgi:hypothetical protein
MTFDKTEWQREYRKRKKMEAEQKDGTKVESETDPDLSLDEKQPEPETAESEQQKPAKKTVKEDIKKPPAKKGKKKGERIPLNPEAFAKMSVGIEKLTLQVHKDKELKDTEQQFIETSATQLAELYEMPKIIVVIQYGAAMVFPHVTRILKAQAEKMELQNEEKKLDLEEKKRKVEEGRKAVNTGEVYKSVMSDAD